MKRIAIIIFICACILSCSHVRPVVETKTVAGEIVQKIDLERTGSRSDVPVGVDPEHVIAQVKTKEGGTITVVKKPFHDAEIYQNQEAVKEAIETFLPSRPWYYWPVRILILVAILAGIIFLLYLRGILSGIMSFFKRV